MARNPIERFAEAALRELESETADMNQSVNFGGSVRRAGTKAINFDGRKQQTANRRKTLGE